MHTADPPKTAFVSVALRSVVMMLVRVFGALSTLGYTIILARVTDAQTLGILLSTISLAMVVSLALSLNFEGGSIRFVAFYRHEQRLEDLSGFISQCRRTVAFMWIPMGVTIAIALWLRKDSADTVTMVLIMTGLAAPLLALARINLRHATALDVTLKAMIPEGLIRPLTFTLFIAIAAVLGQELSGPVLAGLFLVAALFATTLQFSLVTPHMRFLKGIPPRRRELRTWLGLAVATSPEVLVGDYLKNLVLLAAASSLMPAEVAVFGISLSLCGLIDFGIKAVDVATSPRIARAIAQNTLPSLRPLFALASLIKMASYGLGCIIFFYFLEMLLRLMGDDFTGVHATLLPLLAAPLARILFGPAQLVMNISNKKRASLSVSLSGAGTIVAGTAFGAWTAGTVGAAMGMSAAFFIYQGAAFLTCWRETSINTSVVNLRYLRK